MIEELRVHHAAGDAVLFHLAGEGFGRLTVPSAGGDELAKKAIRHIASQETSMVIVTHRRDDLGYVELSLQLADASTSALTLPTSLKSLLATLMKKSLTWGIGTCVLAKVSKRTPNGIVLAISTGLSAAAMCDLSDPEPADEVTVRLLDYDVKAGVAVASVVQGSPPVAAQTFVDFRLGQLIQGVVVHVNREQSCPYIVLKVRSDSDEALVYCPHMTGPSVSLVVGSRSMVCIRYIPSPKMSHATSFLLGQLRESDGGKELDFLRLPSTGGICSGFPWRQETLRKAPEVDESESKLKRRRLEEMVDAFERETEKVPASPDEFKKMLLANPSSSFLWTQYIAFHAGLQQHEKARQVAEKALITINVRESKELLNVWVAYLNLENLHGTTESLQAVFRRSLQYSDNPLVLYEKLADIYHSTDKYQQLCSHCRTMVSKFRSNRSVWVRFGEVLVEGGSKQRDALRKLLKEISTALNKSDQCYVVEHIALHEYRRGSVENGRAMFEGLLSKAPKRSDLWQAFIDQELSLLSRSDPKASVSGIRALFNRLTTVTLPPKVMEQQLTKFLNFELKYGTQPDVEAVRQKARSYVEMRAKAINPTPSNVHDPAK